MNLFSAKEAQVSVAAPIEVKGETVHLSNEGFYFALFPSIGGRAYETDNLFQLEEVGRTLGRIHQIGRKRAINIGRHCLLRTIWSRQN